MRRIAIFCLFTLTTLAQHPLIRHVNYEQAVRDTRTFINLLEDAHPDPYTANGGRIEFHRKAQAILSRLPREGLVAGDLATRLRELIIRLPGHTSLHDDLWWDPAAWLPIQFGVAADALFVAGSDLREFEDLIGCRFIAANGHPVEEIAEKMQTRMSKYENRVGALGGLSGMVRSRKFMLNLFPGDDPDRITFQFRSPTGATVQRTVSWEERRIVTPDKYRSSQPRWSEFALPDDPFFAKIYDRPLAAYLRVANIMGREAYEIAWRTNTGNVRDMLKNYYQRRKQAVPDDIAAALQGVPSFFESATRLLAEMKERQIPTLIIDLRGNSGGWTPSVYPVLYALYGDAYYKKDFPGEYITRQSTLFLQKHNASVEEWRRTKANPLFEPGDYSFETPGEAGPSNARRAKAIAKYKQDGYSFADALERLNGQPVYRPKHVIVLTDPGTYSAAFHCLYYLHHLGAKSVGVPPSQSPNAFMEVTEFTLPESKLHGSIANSLQLYMPEDPKADTFPVTHPVTYQVFLRYGFDRETTLRYALDLIAADKL